MRHSLTTHKRVAHLTSVHPYNDPRIFHKECRSLQRAGYEVFLVAPVAEERRENGIRVLPAGTWRTRWQRLFRTVPRVLVIALRLRASVYHLHDPELLAIAPILRVLGAEVVYDIHEDYVTSLKQKPYLPLFLRTMLAHFVGLLERISSLGCKRIIAERYYEERYPEAQRILNYPILAPVPDVGQVESLDPRFKWYLYTGNVSLDRGALTQLRLLEVNPRAALCYVGNCSPGIAQGLQEYLDARGIASDRLHLIGRGRYVTKALIDHMTLGFDWVAGLALFPPTEHYRKKELTKFFEYMQAGLPILATDTATWRKLIHGKVGFTIDIGDLAALAHLCEELETNVALRARFAAQGREWVRNRFNWDQEEGKLIEFYGRILEPTS
jgi:glycosyltransferase involved in cell wall biosynthesis